MNSIQKEQILRVNCPGFGEENSFSVGKAKALDSYKVIVVNPVSIFHIFDKDAELQREIDAKLGEGLTSLTLPSDAALQTIQDELKSKRILELVSFLEKGGLLVYYLCRPFLVQGDNLAIDNYGWLESLAPDSSPDDNIRHMSAVSHGRVIEVQEEGKASEFAAYFEQQGLEWNTIIRQDFLTDGYTTLATAGPRKCIAAQLDAGEKGGRIVFLPAPYSPDFDKKLIESIELWHLKNAPETGSVPATAQAEAADDLPVVKTATAIVPPPPPVPLAPSLSQSSSPKTDAAGGRITSPEPIRFAPNASDAEKPTDIPKSLFDVDTNITMNENTDRTTSGAHAKIGGNGGTATAGEAKSSLGSILGGLASQSPPESTTASAEDLLRELENLAAKAESQPPHPAENPPTAALDLVAELESLAQKTPTESAGNGNHSPAKGTMFGAMKSRGLFGDDEEDEDLSLNSQFLHNAKSQIEVNPAAASGDTVNQPQPLLEADDLTETVAEIPTQHTSVSYAETSEVPEVPEAKDLIKKMEEISKTPAPDWASQVSFPVIDELKKQRNGLLDQIKAAQSEIAILDNRVNALEALKVTLLGGEGEDLIAACSKVLQMIGWTPNKSEKDREELHLTGEKQPVIARIVRSVSQAKRADIAQLAETVITFWGEHEIEPKGLLVACTWANRPPSERVEPDYTDLLADFAQKQNLCLMTTTQLLCIYRDLELGKTTRDEVRRKIMESSGRFAGFQLEPTLAAV